MQTQDHQFIMLDGCPRKHSNDALSQTSFNSHTSTTAIPISLNQNQHQQDVQQNAMINDSNVISNANGKQLFKASKKGILKEKTSLCDYQNADIQEYKKLRKRIQNRESSQRVRLRKTQHTFTVENELQQIKQRNSELMLQNASLIAENSQQKQQIMFLQSLMLQQQQIQAQQQFQMNSSQYNQQSINKQLQIQMNQAEQMTTDSTNTATSGGFYSGNGAGGEINNTDHSRNVLESSQQDYDNYVVQESNQRLADQAYQNQQSQSCNTNENEFEFLRISSPLSKKAKKLHLGAFSLFTLCIIIYSMIDGSGFSNESTNQNLNTNDIQAFSNMFANLGTMQVKAIDSDTQEFNNNFNFNNNTNISLQERMATRMLQQLIQYNNNNNHNNHDNNYNFNNNHNNHNNNNHNNIMHNSRGGIRSAFKMLAFNICVVYFAYWLYIAFYYRKNILCFVSHLFVFRNKKTKII